MKKCIFRCSLSLYLLSFFTLLSCSSYQLIVVTHRLVSLVSLPVLLGTQVPVSLRFLSFPHFLVRTFEYPLFLSPNKKRPQGRFHGYTPVSGSNLKRLGPNNKPMVLCFVATA
ncbi:hypothetical protein BT96DRAFT_15346 [Gymnopus androsaceus JB14]|uniref:Uncharacterized protein n=1 Tax=Gymnopus androsaceus JB14 TaxID=1447944 RepID=A0A6A4IVV1_9AGAR|nr:hypothetical protein BT96DRAFT_15346 [Gymnopus androsaceus JB14]